MSIQPRTAMLHAPLTLVAAVAFCLATTNAQALRWGQAKPAMSPSARYAHLMVYDTARQQAVLFGGYSGSRWVGDTWLWNGKTWTQALTVTSPSAQSGYSMVYDPARLQVVLFGGRSYSGGLYYGETWIWNGKTWTKVKPTTSPSARSGYSMIYDSARQQVVLFGGYDYSRSRYLGDTWLWNGTTWTQAKPTISPSARANYSMVFDSARQQVVLFGGYYYSYPRSGYLADTWLWNGKSWTQAKSTGSPSARFNYSFVYDSAHQQAVLFGGFGYPRSRYLADTWLWSGKAWTQAKPTTSPSARAGHSMIYDSAGRQVILVGGSTGSRQAGDTWLWNGKAWTQAKSTVVPSARISRSVVYDSKRQQVVLFGGHAYPPSRYLGDTWLWGRLGTASVASYGTPCGTFPGVTLTSSNRTLPALGEKLTFQILGLPRSATSGLLALGLSKASFGTLKLPLDLSSLGMKGCHLYNSFDFQFVFSTSTAGIGTYVLPVPYEPALAGNKIYAQAFGADRTATQIGLVSSNGLELTFGYR